MAKINTLAMKVAVLTITCSKINKFLKSLYHLIAWLKSYRLIPGSPTFTSFITEFDSKGRMCTLPAPSWHWHTQKAITPRICARVIRNSPSHLLTHFALAPCLCEWWCPSNIGFLELQSGGEKHWRHPTDHSFAALLPFAATGVGLDYPLTFCFI